MLLDESAWRDRIFLDGTWVPASVAPSTWSSRPPAACSGGSGGPAPRTSRGRADGAARAQREWAATPAHRAGRGAAPGRGSCGPSTPRRSPGGTFARSAPSPGMAGFALHVAEQECYEAAALAGPAPRRTARQRAAAAVDGAAGAGRRGRGDLAVQRPDHPRHPLRRPGARARQRGGAQARSAHGGHRRRDDGARLRGGRAACRRAAGAARRRRRRRGAHRAPGGAGHLVHRLDRGRPPHRRTGRPPPQARAPRTRRKLRADRARRRRRGRRGRTWRPGVASSTRARSA